ncbi:hypothetical protein K492DRAFT_203559, partial [Lichtheimia hyalospora FSU 10163]
MPSLQIINDSDPDDNIETSTTNQVLCNICQKQFSNYVCPRCNLRYCSLACYKDLEHAECTESFYKESITAEIQSRGGVDTEEKRHMLELLRRFEAENDEILEDDNDDEDQADDLAERLGTLDIETADPAEIWSRLSAQERTAFEQLLRNHDNVNDLLAEYEPWWRSCSNQPKAPRIQALDDDDDDDDNINIPQLPDPLPKIESMVKTIHPDLGWHLCSILMSYCYMMRHFMGEVREDLPSTMTCLEATSILFPGKIQLSSMEDVLVDLMDRLNEPNQPTMTTTANKELIVLLVDDVIQLLESSMYTVRAMADIDMLLHDAIQYYSKKDKRAKHKVFLAEKKAHFYLAYAVHVIQHEELRMFPILLALKTERERMTMDHRVFQQGQHAARTALEKSKEISIVVETDKNC